METASHRMTALRGDLPGQLSGHVFREPLGPMLWGGHQLLLQVSANPLLAEEFHFGQHIRDQ